MTKSTSVQEPEGFFYLLFKGSLFFFIIIIFDVDHFNIFIEFVTMLFLLYGHEACRRLAPEPGIKPTSLHWKAKS